MNYGAPVAWHDLIDGTWKPGRYDSRRGLLYVFLTDEQSGRSICTHQDNVIPIPTADLDPLTEARARLHPRVLNAIEGMAWDLQDEMGDALPREVANELRDRMRDSSLITPDEADAAGEYAYHAILNG